MENGMKAKRRRKRGENDDILEKDATS